VILSGIHIASYGHDLEEKWDLLDLLEKIEEIEGIRRVRIGSIEPMFFKEGRMERIMKLTKLCPHFHLSLQSGSDRTLQRMNRRYTARDFEEVVSELRLNMPEVSITTDVIVGFPGESEEEFQETYRLLVSIKFTKVNNFKYSQRKGTPAFNMKDQVSSEIKDLRSKRIMSQSDENEQAFLSSCVNKTLEVLFEEGKEGVHFGYTNNYVKVRVESDDNIQGEYVETKITGVKDDFLCGKII